MAILPNEETIAELLYAELTRQQREWHGHNAVQNMNDDGSVNVRVAAEGVMTLHLIDLARAAHGSAPAGEEPPPPPANFLIALLPGSEWVNNHTRAPVQILHIGVLELSGALAVIYQTADGVVHAESQESFLSRDGGFYRYIPADVVGTSRQQR